MLEDITFQMCNLTEAQINKHLAGPIALLKYKQSRVATLVSDGACQIFGGRAITRTGKSTRYPQCPANYSTVQRNG